MIPFLLLTALIALQSTAAFQSDATLTKRCIRRATSSSLLASPTDVDSSRPTSFVSRKGVFSAFGGLILSASIATVPARAEDAPSSIAACVKPASGNANCVSTASVRQVDLYAPPWTFPDTMSADEAMARLKGLINSDSKLEILQQSDRYLKVKGTRNLGTDEIEFLVNPHDKVVTFVSQRIDDPEASDFGANRKRLEEMRKKSPFGVMGQEYLSADTAPRENALGQLKAFYGLRSGSGYEDLLLDDD